MSPEATKPSNPSRSSTEIQEWAVRRIAAELKTEQQFIDPKAPFLRYGLNSVGAVAITADLSDWLGREVDPALFWDFPNLEALANHLAKGGQ